MTGRYCLKCGGRIASDGRMSMCSPCRRVSGSETDRAPTLTRDFWSTDRMRDAFDSRVMGEVVHAYRHHPAHGHKPLPQEAVSRWLGITQSQLSRIESGRNKVNTIEKLIHYALALKMPADYLWFELPKNTTPTVDLLTGSVLALPGGGPVVRAVSVNAGSGLADSLLATLGHYGASVAFR